jgi:hypothetical protein
MSGMSSLPTPGMEEITREVESIKRALFAFHPWMPHSNFGPDGFRFNIPYPTLERLTPIPLVVFPYPEILPRRGSAFAFLGANAFDAVPSVNSQSRIQTRQQPPAQSMTDLKTAYGKYGMVELKTLAAADEAEFANSFILFEAVMSPGRTEAELNAGRRPANLLLEDFPEWLTGYAASAYKYAVSKGVVIKDNLHKVRPDQNRAEKLIQEIHAAIMLTHEAALSPSVGILPKTREALNIAANKGQGGKMFKDNQDLWLEQQFPSFPMDTDVERTGKALQSAMETTAQATNDGNSTIAAVLERMDKRQEATEKVLLELLKERKAGK